MAQSRATKELARQRKITVKTVCGSEWFEKMMEAKDKRLPLMAVYGIARNFKPGASDYGAFVAFLGEFQAVNLATGEQFASAKILLPKVAEEALAAVVSGDGTKEIKFAFQIDAVYNGKNATKYEYVFTPLMQSSDSSAMNELRQLVSKETGIKALAAPAAEPAKAS